MARSSAIEGEGTSDVTLLQQVAGGDRAAFTALYRRLERPLYGYLMKLVRDREMVEDLLSETLLEVWRQAARFEGRAAVGTWAFSIAHHRAVSRLRRKRETALDEEAVAAIADGDPTPDQCAMAADMNRHLAALIEQLSFDHREVLHLAYYQEFSVAEIAETLDLPVNTVKTRMFYARRRLKVMLQKSGIVRAVA